MGWVQTLRRWLAPAPPPPLNQDHAGPVPDEHPATYVGDVMRSNWGEAGMAGAEVPQPWVSGWYLHAKQRQAHKGRIGPVIVPQCVVVHTTDMMPDTHDAIVESWTTKAGAGNAAHFLISRDGGITQFAQITRNANHAGGKTHGWFKTATGALIHPNTVAVGIELHSAGRLSYVHGRWVHLDSGKVIPDADVIVDAKNHGWHVVTAAQLRALETLLTDLNACIKPLPQGCKVVPNGTYVGNGVAPWAVSRNVQVVGHVTLDPTDKTDPGPQVMDWLRAENFA